MSKAPTMPPAPPKGGSAIKRPIHRTADLRPVEDTTNYNSDPDLIDTIIAVEIVNDIMSNDTSSYDYDSDPTDFGGGGDFGGAGSDSSW